MAETLRALGDLSTTELFGPVERLLEELREDGRAVRIDLPGTAEPMRWVLAEDETRYRRAFPSGGEHDLGALGSIVRQYLRTHALIGMAELCRRYPIAPELAAEMLDHWVETGGLIRLAAAGPEAECRWAEPENLAEIHRLSVAIRRRESVAVAPEVFADFLLRRQHLHPATRLDGPGGLEAALQQLQGYAAAAEFWESEILPRRVRGYRTAWLDDLLATGCWLWRRPAMAGTSLRSRWFPAISQASGDAAWTRAKSRRTSGRSSTSWPAGAPASRPTWRGSRVWSPRGCAALSAT